MNGTVLVAYGTKHGSTREVAQAIAETIEGAGMAADVRPAVTVRDLDGYSAVVLGGSIYMGRWHRDAHDFLERHGEALADLPLAVFGMGPASLEPDKVAGARRELDAGLAKTPEVVPDRVAVFGGVIDPSKLRFPFSRMPASDARDWDAIRLFGREVVSLARGGREPALA